MVSSWCLVSQQARDSVDPGPLLGQRPPFLPVRYPPGRRLQDPQGPCLQSLLRSRSRARVGPVDSLLLVRGNVSRGPEGVEFLLAPLYVSYLGSCCPSQCIGVRVPGNWPADPRAAPPRSHPFSAPPFAYAVSRLALPRACWVVCRPRAPLRQPRSVPAGRGRYAARPAISAGGRFPLRCGPVPRSAPLTNGGRHSRALGF
ncbi:hypothetical protein NDU88_001083 [Pleurodeles waltl]|uniref:Uncharacterized protein n=1 Tax=Pleurodeles waltl TaxID=8319 RepID=A0AAV7URU8_PLEWA|nr:hypothetical protein NDU88_001083 [Pleurodeles waltl]